MSFAECQDVGSTVDRAGNAQLTAKLSVNLSRWLNALSCPFRVCVWCFVVVLCCGHCLVWPELTDCHYHGRCCRYSLLATTYCWCRTLPHLCGCQTAASIGLPPYTYYTIYIWDTALHICLVGSVQFAIRAHFSGCFEWQSSNGGSVKWIRCPGYHSIPHHPYHPDSIFLSPVFGSHVCALRVFRLVCPAFVCVFWHTSICVAFRAYNPAKDKDDYECESGSEGFAASSCACACVCVCGPLWALVFAQLRRWRQFLE